MAFIQPPGGSGEESTKSGYGAVVLPGRQYAIDGLNAAMVTAVEFSDAVYGSNASVLCSVCCCCCCCCCDANLSPAAVSVVPAAAERI